LTLPGLLIGFSFSRAVSHLLIALIAVIAVGCSLSIGYGANDGKKERPVPLGAAVRAFDRVLPIGDIDSPAPQNLGCLATSLPE
jgi:hypothetical protein